MCYPRPAPRCSDHAGRRLKTILNQGLASPRSASHGGQVAGAVEDYLATPAGAELLETGGAVDLELPEQEGSSLSQAALDALSAQAGDRWHLKQQATGSAALIVRANPEEAERARQEHKERLAAYKTAKENGELAARGENPPKIVEKLSPTVTDLEQLQREARKESMTVGVEVSPSEIARRNIETFFSNPQAFLDPQVIMEAQEALRFTGKERMVPSQRGKYIYRKGFASYARQEQEGKVGRKPTDDSTSPGMTRDKNTLSLRLEADHADQAESLAKRLSISRANLLTRIATGRPVFQLDQSMGFRSMMNHCAGALTASQQWSKTTPAEKAKMWKNSALALDAVAAKTETKEMKSVRKAKANGIIPAVRVAVDENGHVSRFRFDPTKSVTASKAERFKSEGVDGYTDADMADGKDSGDDLYLYDKADNVIYLFDRK